MTGNRSESHFVTLIFIFLNVMQVLSGLSDLRTLAYSISFYPLKSYLAVFFRKIPHFLPYFLLFFIHEVRLYMILGHFLDYLWDIGAERWVSNTTEV